MAFYIALLFLNALIGFSLAVYAWRQRDVPGAQAFFWFLMITSVWSALSATSTIMPTEAGTRILNLYARYVMIAIAPVSLLAFCLEYTGRGSWLNPLRIGLLSVIPIGIQIAHWVAPVLFLSEVTYETVQGFRIIDASTNGPLFWVHTAYSYVLILTVVALLIMHTIRAAPAYRGQSALLVIGTLPPQIANMMIVTGLLENPPPDLTAVTFLITGIIWTFALFRFRLLDLMPIARDVVIESMEDAVLVLDKSNRVVDINPAAERVLNRNRSEVVGLTLLDVLPERRELLQRFAGVDEARTEIEVGESTFDLRISTLQRRGRISGRLIVLRDITKRKQAELERERLIEELDAYAHTVAHDLKDPLGVISGAVEFLEMENLSEQRRQRYTQMIGRTGEKMVSIIDELLLLASVREMKDIKRTRLDMDTIMKDVLQRLQNDVAETAIRMPEKWPAAYGYAPWVEEVWVNYVSNAVKYGGKPPRIELGAKADTTHIRFWVRDNGSGLTEEEQSQLFTEFVRVQARVRGGHGLGLSIVRRIVERLEGEVGVESVVGQGSTFYFTLPMPPDAGS